MPPVVHSKKYSPSKSNIWTKCALSTLLNQDDGSFGDAAIFGTQCHELGEAKIRMTLGIKNYDEEAKPIEELRKSLDHYNDDMESIADGYADSVVKLFEYYKSISFEKPILFLEQHIDMDFDETAGGTLDMGLYSDVDGGTIVIEDLKTGRKPVYAKDLEKDYPNSQLGIYAIYFYESVIKGLYPVKNVRLIIHQPVISNTNEFSLTLEELLKFKEEVVLPAVARTKVKELEAVAGSHCEYCTGRHLCRKYNEENLKVGEEISKPVEEFTDKEIEAILPKLDDFIKYAEDLKDYAIKKANEGHKWKGYKLVPSKVTRKITNEEKVKEILEKEGISPLNPGKLIGITEITKRLGKEKFKELISPYVELVESSLILVPEADPRKEAAINTEVKE